MLALDFQDIVKALTGGLNPASIPQTQADLRTLAKTAETVQSPEFQAQIDEARREATAAAKWIVGIQIVVAVSAFGMFLLALKKELK